MNAEHGEGCHKIFQNRSTICFFCY